MTSDRPAYSAGGYPREFTPAANAHQSYGRQEFPTPAAVAEQPASQDWGAYVASRVAPGRPADVAPVGPPTLHRVGPSRRQSGRPDDLESTTIFNRRDFDEDGRIPTIRPRPHSSRRSRPGATSMISASTHHARNPSLSVANPLTRPNPLTTPNSSKTGRSATAGAPRRGRP